MDLKELLGEELFTQVSEKITDKHKLGIISDGTWIPKEKFDTVNTEKNTYKTQTDTMTKQLEELQTKVKGNEEATLTIEGLKKQLLENDAKIAGVKKDSAIQLALINAKAKNPKAVMALLKLDTVELAEDGTVKGLAEQLKAIQETDGYLFGDLPNPGGGDNPPNAELLTKVQALEKELEEARKAGNTALVVALKNKLFELNKKK